MQPDSSLMKFDVTFDDGEIIHGEPLGSLNTGWNGLPDKPIKSLAYTNPYGGRIVLENYEEYNHMVECIQNIGESPHVTDVYLMGASNGQVVVYRITAFQRTREDAVQVGDMTVRVCQKGKEYTDSETWGWRRGIDKGQSCLSGQADGPV